MSDPVKVTYRGAVIIITEPARRRYIVQRKDNRHPNPDVRRALCFWGGGIGANEDPREAALRELNEEIRIPLPAASLRHYFTDTFSAKQWPGDYEAHVFEMMVSDQLFERLAAGLPMEHIAEGIGECVTVEYLVSCAIGDPAFFVASHGEVFIRYVQAVIRGERGDGSWTMPGSDPPDGLARLFS